MKSDTRDILINLSLVLGSVILVLMIFEAGLQLNLIRSPFAEVDICSGDPDRIAFHKEYGWVRPPNSAFLESKTGEKEFELYAHNNEGFRDRFDSGDRNVIVLGDSFTYGVLVSNNETFTQLLDRSNSNLSFHNYGMSGYSTAQELQVYRNVSDDIDHDLVILNYFLGNDARENMAHNSHLGKRPIFSTENGKMELKKRPEPIQHSGFKQIYFETPLYQVESLKIGYNLYRGLSSGGNREIARPPEGKERDRQIRRTRDLLLRLSEATRQNDAHLMINVIPERGEVDPNKPDFYPNRTGKPYWQAQREMIKNIGKRPNTEAVFLKKDLDPAHYGNGNAHLNEKGHRAVAKVIKKQYKEISKETIDLAKFDKTVHRRCR